MSNLDIKKQYSDNAIIRFWQRMPILIRAILSGLFVSTIGVMAWVVILTVVPSPWFIVVMGCVLIIFWKYFSGNWWPKATAKARSNSFREMKLATNVWKWSLLGAVLFVVVVQSSFVVTFQIMEFPAEAFASEYNFDTMPLWLAWLVIVMASLVAGICEETGFRGYMQVPLEKRYGPGVGITIVSIMFLVIHLDQAWAPPVFFHLFAMSVLLGILAYSSGSLIPSMIAHAVVDIFNFSYWWSDIAGRFEKRTIFETRDYFYFIVWFLIFGISLFLFFWVAQKITTVRRKP